jgi:hypothetical protein
MASSSVGSDIFFVSALLVIGLLVLLLLRHYMPLRTTPGYLIVPIFLALALPASIILLVPIDLASGARTESASGGIWLPDRVLLVAWRISYWLTFMLTWVILPLMGEYIDSGYRTPRDRILYSLRSNGRYQLVVLGCGIAGLVYVIFQNGFHPTSIKALVMALAYCWGLILAIYLMGHGLVAIPRRLIRNANIAGRLRRIQSHAPKVHDRLTDAITNLEELEAQVAQLHTRKTGTARDFKEWIEELSEMTTLPESRPSTNPSVREAPSQVPAVITEKYLAELTRRLNRARHERARFIEEWDHIVQTASDTQTILDSKASKHLSFGRSSPSSSFLTRVSLLTPYTRYLLHVNILPPLRLSLAVFLSLASACIVWSEIVKFPFPHWSIISLTVKPNPTQPMPFGNQLLAALWLLYMCTTTLTAISSVPIWGNRALVRRNTYGESACWYAGQIAKLTVPLSYNFLTFLPQETREATTFYKFLGKLVNLTPLGKGFDYFFPILILVPVCATLFNLYGRIKTVFGFGILDDEDDEENPSGFGTGGWREGRELIERDLAGANAAIGLSPRPSLDTNPAAKPGPAAARSAPTLWVPPASRDRSNSPLPTPSNSNASARPAPTSTSRPREPSPDRTEEENFFQLFGRRVKNTFETANLPSVNKPAWLENNSRNEGETSSSGAGFKRPKWMRGKDGGDEGSASGLGRWFGGRQQDGRLRL